MLPGKKYTPEDVLSILKRRFWLLIVPLAVIGASTGVVGRALPDLYRSDTLILVVPQRVPENFVKSTVTARIEDRLGSITQQILSRTRLERVIQDFDLYAEERRTGIMEDIIERMRTREIQVQVVKGDAFRVSYIGREPRTVMKVTERLASLFIEENLRDRELQAEGTNLFLENQLEDARRRLIEQEKKLEAYRRQHTGELPSELNSNLQVIQNTQMQIQAMVESLNRDHDRRLVLERQIAEAAAAPAELITPAASPGSDSAPPASAAQQLEAARAQLQALELRLKSGHPDIGLMRRRIRDLERKAEAEALSAPVTPESAPRATSPAEFQRQQRLAALRGELEQLDRQTAQKVEDERRLRAVSQNYQARAEAAPARETELVELMRDYTTIQSMYTTLLQKKEESKIAANLERRQIGESFKLLDPARLPERPFSPDRRTINVGGVLAGLGLGLALIALLEYKDSSFKTDAEVASVLSLPVLAVVPLMHSDAERRRLFKRRLVVGVGLGSTVTACLAVLVYTFVR
jgi:polysaccharide chain length determinant protein (PEP-CTERM system associated)